MFFFSLHYLNKELVCWGLVFYLLLFIGVFFCLILVGGGWCHFGLVGCFLACLLSVIKHAKKKRHQNSHLLVNKVKGSCGTSLGRWLDSTFL